MPSERRPPPKYKMAALAFLGLVGPVYAIPPWLQARLPGQRLVVVVLAVALIVMLMTYVIMPMLTRLFATWLESASRPSCGRSFAGSCCMACDDISSSNDADDRRVAKLPPSLLSAAPSLRPTAVLIRAMRVRPRTGAVLVRSRRRGLPLRARAMRLWWPPPRKR